MMCVFACWVCVCVHVCACDCVQGREKQVQQRDAQVRELNMRLRQLENEVCECVRVRVRARCFCVRFSLRRAAMRERSALVMSTVLLGLCFHIHIVGLFFHIEGLFRYSLAPFDTCTYFTLLSIRRVGT